MLINSKKKTKKKTLLWDCILSKDSGRTGNPFRWILTPVPPFMKTIDQNKLISQTVITLIENSEHT